MTTYTGPERIVSGGQTGADRGGLDAALELGIPHGGWCPAGRLAEDGRIPDRYVLRETKSSDYKARTRLNVTEAHGTLIFNNGATLTGGTLTTRKACTGLLATYLIVNLEKVLRDQSDEPALHYAAVCVRNWLFEVRRPQALNVAGPRESKAPGIQDLVRRILVEAIRSNGEG